MKTDHIRYIDFKNTDTLTSYVSDTIQSAKTLKDKIQVAAVGILMHVGRHGDKPTGCRLANQLVNDLGKGIQTKALADYFLAFGAQLADDNKSFADWDIEMLKARFNKSSTNPKAIREGAKNTHWATFAPESPWSGFKLDDKLESLLKQAGKAQERASSNPEEATVVDINTDKLDLLSIVSNMSESQCSELLNSLKVETSEHEEFKAA